MNHLRTNVKVGASARLLVVIDNMLLERQGASKPPDKVGGSQTFIIDPIKRNTCLKLLY